MPAICCICLGNICRSPAAEAIFLHLIKGRRDAANWQIDSAGTGNWHVGHRPDPRTLRVLANNGYATDHRGRQLSSTDFFDFDWLLAMDDNNMSELTRCQPKGGTAKLALLGDWDSNGPRQVADPYYGEEAGFVTMLEQLERCCQGFLQAEYPLTGR